MAAAAAAVSVSGSVSQSCLQ